MAYVLLFLSAFGAATLLPLQSETVLAGLFLLGKLSLKSKHVFFSELV